LSLDPASAGLALRATHRLRLVTLNLAMLPEIEITYNSRLYRRFTTPGAPEWIRLIGDNLETWLALRPRCWMQQPLALSAALGNQFVDFCSTRVRITPELRLHRDMTGRPLQISTELDAPAFLDWLHTAVRS
ncbi:hypothetical protein, partial [Streptomyces roseolus]|uniref:hypothetical protein n=1 Tax=Streptomyces roseolus TaxID=67358 RepID=UPI00365DF137